MLETIAPLVKNTIKLTDFTYACVCSADQELCDRVGSPFYMAPEVVEASYNRLCDIWSCGVVLCRLLNDQLPFKARTQADVFVAVRNRDFDFAPCVSEDARELVRGLMMHEPQERWSIQAALLQCQRIRLNGLHQPDVDEVPTDGPDMHTDRPDPSCAGDAGEYSPPFENGAPVALVARCNGDSDTPKVVEGEQCSSSRGSSGDDLGHKAPETRNASARHGEKCEVVKCEAI